MKLIYVDKLIEKLSANLDNPEEFPVISLGTILRMIDNEPEVVAHPEQKWIPVSERLPEEEGFYIVTDDSGGTAWVNRSYYMPLYNGGVYWDYLNVTAWMPLPEPYKGGNK